MVRYLQIAGIGECVATVIEEDTVVVLVKPCKFVMSENGLMGLPVIPPYAVGDRLTVSKGHIVCMLPVEDGVRKEYQANTSQVVF